MKDRHVIATVVSLVVLVAGVGLFVASVPLEVRGDMLVVTVPPGTSVPSVTSTPPASSVPSSGSQAGGEIAAAATVTAQAERGQQVRVATTVPSVVPATSEWGRSNSTISGRCTQFEPLLELQAPDDGWDVIRMSGYMDRESACCPMLQHLGGVWATTRGGDRAVPRYEPDDPECLFSHVAEWNHRSDAGALQINGISYDPTRCKNTCLSVWLGEPVTAATLGDPVQNVRAAAALCEFSRRAFGSCYQPWS